MLEGNAYTSASQNRPEPQAEMTVTVAPAVASMDEALRNSSPEHYFHLPGAANDPNIFSILQDDLLFTIAGSSASSNQTDMFGLVKSNTAVMSALNGLNLSPEAINLINAMVKRGIAEKFIRMFIESQVKFVGISPTQSYKHQLNNKAASGDLKISISVNGIYRAICRGSDIRAFESLRARVPTRAQYGDPNWRTEISDDPEHDGPMTHKISMYFEKVDPKSAWEDLMECFAAKLKGDEKIDQMFKDIAPGSAEMLPIISVPHTTHQFLKSFGITLLGNAVKAGVVLMPDPDSDSAGQFQSSKSDSEFEDVGWSALNFLDGLRFQKNGSGQKSFPVFGETQVGDIFTFGDTEDNRALSNEDAGNELTVALAQLSGISLSCDAPINSASAYDSEGFYMNVSDNQNVIDASVEKLEQFFHETIVNVMAKVLTSNDRFTALPGYNHATKSNNKVIVTSNSQTKFDVTRDAGCASSAIVSAFPAFLAAVCNILYQFNTTDAMATKFGKNRQYCEVSLKIG